ncbi:MAG: hypothetical protein QM778_23140 [Myxococcales bacterium]
MRTLTMRFWQLLLLSALALAPAACGGDKNDDTEEPPPPPGDGDGDANNDAGVDGGSTSDAGTDGGVKGCQTPTTSEGFLNNECGLKSSIQRVKFDNASRLPAGSLPAL